LVGQNLLSSQKKRVLRITTERLTEGPLFRSYLIRYDFDGGGIYTATVKIVAGYSFVDFTEQMEGLTKTDQAFVEMNWTGFHPTHRYPAGDFDAQTKHAVARN